MTDSRLPSRARPQPRATALLLACFLFPRRNSDPPVRYAPVPCTTTQPELVRVESGRLVDVYGLENGLITRYRDDVLVAAGIEDERPSTSEAGDNEITYDFFGTDPDTLQPRLLITRPLGSEAFRSAFDALDDGLRSVTPMRFGQAGRGTPFSVVPRNAALRLTFSAPLGVGDDFFVERDGGGRVVGLRNTEAVQLLSIVREPGQPEAFVPLPVRVIARERALVLDPVLLGGEGVQYQTVNNAAGLPESPDSFGANIRIALPL